VIYYNFVANIPCFVSLPSGGKVRLYAGGTLRVSEQDGQFLNSPSSSDFTSLRLISIDRSEESEADNKEQVQILGKVSEQSVEHATDENEEEEHLPIISNKRSRNKSS
jgi:endonuclease YncB( thermonuclease family)